MEVHKHLEVWLLEDGFFRSQNGWVELLVSRHILPIEVLTLDIESPVTSRNSIRVEHWNNLEYIVVQESPSLNIVKVGKLIKDTLQHVLGWGLSAVHPRGEEYYRLLSQESILGCQSDLVHWSALHAMN